MANGPRAHEMVRSNSMMLAALVAQWIERVFPKH